MSDDTLKFLSCFGTDFWLQTFDDKKRKGRKDLVHDYWIDEKHPILMAKKILNTEGAGVYFCVNQLRHMHKKRTADNVEAIRAFFVDLDGAPLAPVLNCNLKPNIIVHSSAVRWHAYWIMDDYVAADRRLFKELQRNIADRFAGDPSVSDLCRVMRLPGFYNMKAEPFMVTYDVISEKPYNLKEVQDAFNRPDIIHNSSQRISTMAQQEIPEWITLQGLIEDAGRGLQNTKTDMEFDAARLRGAMLAINVDEYEAWITVMICLKGSVARGEDMLSDEEAFEYFNSWSETGAKYDSVVVEAKWQGTEGRGEMGLGTLFKMAAEAGWKGERRAAWDLDEVEKLLKTLV